MARDISKLSVAELRRLLADPAQPLTARWLSRLEADPRAGVRALASSARRRFERDRKERLRLDAMLNFERVLWRQGITRIAGVDEAGTGPLAGPVVAAAVVFPPGVELPGIDDSKRLDPDLRLARAEEIRKHAAWAVGVAEVEEIDELNVYHAALLAMRRAVESLPEPPEHVLVDARTIPGITAPQNPFPKGDGINYTIAAASIIAKTHRDALMEALDREHPGYGLARHKGYATPEHQAAIRRLGPSPAHRSSFDYIRQLCGESSERFYDLQRGLERTGDRAALAAWTRTLDAAKAELTETEWRKLRLLGQRRAARLRATPPAGRRRAER